MTHRVPNIGTFFSSKNMETMWNFVVTLLRYVAPGVMIVVAFFAVAMMIKMIIKAFKKGTETDEDVRRRKDTDDDYDMKYY